MEPETEAQRVLKNHGRNGPGADRLPPHDDVAEAAILGSILLAPDCLTECQVRFGSDDPFYDLRNQVVWAALCYLKAQGVAIDEITLRAELKARGQLEQVGEERLGQLQDDVPSAANLSAWLDVVWGKFIARRLIQKDTENVQWVMAADGLSESFVAQLDERHERWKKLFERGQMTPKNLCEPLDFEKPFYDCWFEREREDYGWHLPFNFPMHIRPSEMTLFTGDNGSGKSSMLGQISIVCAQQFQKDEKVVIASMEVPPEVTLWIMARQLLGVGRLEKTDANEKKTRDAMAWLQNHVLLYNFLGITDWRELLSTFHYARTHRNGAFFIVDSVMRIGIPDDDYALQGLVAAQFADFCVKTGAHTCLVVHENKGDGRQKDKVRGSKQWTDNAHNVCAIKRNEQKAEKIEEWRSELKAGALTPEKFDEKMEGVRKVWDSKFILNKQRWPGSQQNASRWLYFDRGSLQFHEEPGKGAYNFLL